MGAESSQLRVYQRLLEQGRPSRGFESAFPWLPRVIYGLGAEPEPSLGCTPRVGPWLQLVTSARALRGLTGLPGQK